MSIDARIDFVVCNEDGSGELQLIDRPARPGGVPGIRGQGALFFDKSPHEVTALNGMDIWGGSGEVILGDIKIADRLGYGPIAFVADDKFKSALTAYKKR